MHGDKIIKTLEIWGYYCFFVGKIPVLWFVYLSLYIYLYTFGSGFWGKNLRIFFFFPFDRQNFFDGFFIRSQK